MLNLIPSPANFHISNYKIVRTCRIKRSKETIQTIDHQEKYYTNACHPMKYIKLILTHSQTQIETLVKRGWLLKKKNSITCISILSNEKCSIDDYSMHEWLRSLLHLVFIRVHIENKCLLHIYKHSSSNLYIYI